MTATANQRPIIALAMGDPAGVSPELTAKLVALDDVRAAARLVVIGDKRVFDDGARVAGTQSGFRLIGAADAIPSGDGPVFVDLAHLDPATIERGVATRAGGAFALANYRHALQRVARGEAGAVCFTPFNKQAMRLADASYDDEIGFTAGVLGTTGPATEFNILEGLWNARVTSHVPHGRHAEAAHRRRDRRRAGTHGRRAAGGGLRAAAHCAWRHSIRMPATAATSGARKSTSSSRR